MNNTIEKTKKGRVVVLPWTAENSPNDSSAENDFVVDEDDYLVVREIIMSCLVESDDVGREARSLIKICDNDGRRRVCELAIPLELYEQSIPDSIGRLKHLATLDLHWAGIASIPPSIGQLHNLRDLDLSHTEFLSQLPKEIGNLASLEILDLENSAVTSLPSSIGRLKSLTDLNLSLADNLLKLPEEIGDLISLKKLRLHCAEIASLPPSIGRLQNLEDLNLSWTPKLYNLPEEIGDLLSMNNLNLKKSSIASLPPSIGKLKNLKDLNLSYTENLVDLPEEIGGLVNLDKLDLGGSSIASLPCSLKRLQNLSYLDLSDTMNLRGPSTEIGHLSSNLKVLDLSGSMITLLPDSIGRLKGLMFLSIPDVSEKNLFLFAKTVAHDCPVLGLIETREGSLDKAEEEKLDIALACNRAGYRTGFCSMSDAASIRTTPNLWPNVLYNATRAFDWYTNPCHSKSSTEIPFSISKPTAIYQLLHLFDGRESFLQMLFNKSKTIDSDYPFENRTQWETWGRECARTR